MRNRRLLLKGNSCFFVFCVAGRSHGASHAFEGGLPKAKFPPFVLKRQAEGEAPEGKAGCRSSDTSWGAPRSGIKRQNRERARSAV